MRARLAIFFRGMDPSSPLRGPIVEGVKRLEVMHPEVTGFDVTVDKRPARPYCCRQFNVRLEMHVRERDLVVNRENDEDPMAALRDALNVAARQLDDIDARR